MDRLRIGVIGLGWFGEIHAETIAGVPDLELAALCTRTPDRLAAMGEKFGVKKLFRDYNDLFADPDIDAVSICTMWDQHREPAIAALKAGKHVFLEKPIASTVDDGRAITAAAKADPVTLRSVRGRDRLLRPPPTRASPPSRDNRVRARARAACGRRDRCA